MSLLNPNKTFLFCFHLLLFFILGCGASVEEKTSEAVLSANILLSQGKCQEAIDVLEENGRINDNAVYLQTLASAYACLSGYREPKFFVTDLPLTASPSPLGGTAKYSTATNMAMSADSRYLNMQKAIEILLYAGGLPTGQNPTAVARIAKFTEGEGLDIHTQLLFMILEQLGRFYRYYGNSSSSGVKATGTNGNLCFVNYENVALDVGTDLSTSLALGATGACNTIGFGHADLGTVGSLNISRMCKGVILVNNLLDILPKVLGSSTSTDFTVISTLQTTITTLKTALATASTGSGNISSVTSQFVCEAQNALNDDYIQIYYALIFEKLFL